MTDEPLFRALDRAEWKAILARQFKPEKLYGDEVTADMLADEEKVTPPTASSRLNALWRKGLLARRRVRLAPTGTLPFAYWPPGEGEAGKEFKERPNPPQDSE